MKTKRRKTIKVKNAIKPLISKNWGLWPNRVIWTIESIISPMVTHADIVWARPDKVGALHIMCEHIYRPLLIGKIWHDTCMITYLHLSSKDAKDITLLC